MSRFIKKMMDRLRTDVESCFSIVFVSSPELAGVTFHYCEYVPRHYIGDWFVFLNDHENRDYFLHVMRTNQTIREARFSFCLKAEECKDIRTEQLDDLFRFLGTAIGLLKVREIEVYVNWRNTFDGSYAGIRELMERTKTCPLRVLRITYPIDGFAMMETNVNPSLMNHPSLEDIDVYIMFYNQDGDSLFPYKAAHEISFKPTLFTIPNLKSYAISNMKRVENDYGKVKEEYDTLDFLSYNYDGAVKEAIATRNQPWMRFDVSLAKIRSVDISGFVVRDDPNIIFHPYSQNAVEMRISFGQDTVKVSVSTEHYERHLDVTLPANHEVYSALTELSSKRKVKEYIKISEDIVRVVPVGLDYFFQRLKSKVLRLNIILPAWNDKLCNASCSYLKQYGHKDLDVEFGKGGISNDGWEQLCSGLAQVTTIGEVIFDFPEMTTQQLRSGMMIIQTHSKRVERLEIRVGSDGDSGVHKVLDCAEITRNHSPIQKLVIWNPNADRAAIFSHEQGTQLCDLLRENYCLCHFLGTFHFYSTWLRSQIQSMMSLNSLGRKYLLEGQSLNRKYKGTRFLEKLYDLDNIFIHLLENPSILPSDTNTLNILNKHGRLRLLLQEDDKQMDKEVELLAAVANDIDCIYLRLLENPSICKRRTRKRKCGMTVVDTSL